MIKLKPGYIAGIHNYCDRWCERCYFTSRCNVFENTSDLSPAELDITNKAFWDRLSNNFKDALELLQTAAKEHGIDLRNIPPEANVEYERKEKEIRGLAKEHVLGKISMEYTTKAMKLLKNKEMFTAKGEELIKHFEIGIQTEEQAMREANAVKECVEVIQWYLHFIYVKFQRALHGKLEDDGWEEANGFQRDCDGSAKIALIAVERTMEAWLQLMQLLPECEDEIIILLSLLDRIKKTGDQEFPKARKFIRPGFDEMA